MILKVHNLICLSAVLIATQACENLHKKDASDVGENLTQMRILGSDGVSRIEGHAGFINYDRGNLLDRTPTSHEFEADFYNGIGYYINGLYLRISVKSKKGSEKKTEETTPGWEKTYRCEFDKTLKPYSVGGCRFYTADRYYQTSEFSWDIVTAYGYEDPVLYEEIEEMERCRNLLNVPEAVGSEDQVQRILRRNERRSEWLKE